MKRLSYSLALLCAAVAAQAQTRPTDAVPGGVAASPVADALERCLPAQGLVSERLRNSPQVRAAAAKKQGMDARARALEAGQAEFSLKASLQRRGVSDLNQRFTETSVGLERPWRSAAKREVDTQLARQTEALARIEYADALHEAGRELMKTWFDTLRAHSALSHARQGLALAQQMQQQVAARQRQGEVSQLDADLALAEQQRAHSAVDTAQAQGEALSASLRRRYPGLPLPALMLPPALPENPGEQEALRTEFLQKNHEINTLRLDAQRLRLAAQRADLERHGDPTLGVFVARERAGAENLAGITLSLPLGSAARSAQSDQAWAEAAAAAARVEAAEQQLGAQFDAQWMHSLHQRAAAEHLQQAAHTQAQALSKARKGYALGEGSMAELLQIARSAADSRQAAERLQWEAVEALLLVRLDLHQLWDFDD